MTTIKKLSLRIALECLVVGLLFAGIAAAQTFNASIGGIVKDSSGAVVPGVKVVVMDKATNGNVSTVTNGAGVYSVPFLNSSTYRVTFSKEGFKSDVEENVPLVLNQQARVDVVLVIGSTTQSVTVTATAPQIDRESGVIGSSLSNADLLKFPEGIGSHGPNELSYVKIFPGMSGSSPSYSNTNNISIAGGRADSTPIIEDGLPSNMAVDNTYGFTPTPDSTGELQVLLTPYSAQYGATGGGAILTSTKSGTNNLHGALFEYHNDQALNAVDFFTNSSPGARPVRGESITNYFGGSAGGPVYIPHLWNGRTRRTFFFTDLEETINLGSKSLNTNVPTAAERQGDFSGLSPTNTATPTIYNPATTVVVGSTVTRTAFPGNIITTVPDPIAAKILSYYPTPNCTNQTFNYCVQPKSYHTYLYNNTRVDQEIGDYDRLWFRYSRDGPWTQQVQYIPGPANPNATNGWRDYHEEATWTHIFSPSITNEFRLGQVEEDNFTLANNQDVASLGLPNVPPAQFPGITATGLYTIGGLSPSNSLDRFQIINDALQMQKGKHSLKVGGEFIRYMFNQYSPGNLTGGYAFTGTYTSTTISGKASGGMAAADLYLGQVNTASLTTNNYEFRYRLNTSSLYFQDDYKITSKLTLNLGLRWELDGPTTEVNDWLYSMNPTLTDATTGKLGAVQFAGRNGAPRHFLPNDYHGFLPRAGFAYSLGHNTVVRGGAGLFELPSIGYMTTGSTNDYSRSCSYKGVNTYTPAFQLQNGLTPCAYNQNSAGLPNLVSSLTSPTQGVAEFQLTPKIPVLQEWSLSVQHQFGHGWVGEIDYIGNKGTHEPVSLAMNQIVPIAGCCYGQTTPTPQSLRPYPQWNGVTYFSLSGNSNYNGLILRMQHYWMQGLSTLFTYTYAKTMDDVDGINKSDGVANQNTYNLASQYGVAMIDMPQRFTASYVWLVPIGAGGKFAENVKGLNQLLGHWEFGGVTQFQPGYPYAVSQTNTMGLFNGAQYTSTTGISPYNKNPTVAEWFNPAAFTPTGVDLFGTTPRAALFGPGQNNWDISLSRNFPIKEKITLQVRGDFSNAFNHVQFSNLNTSCTTIVSGACGGAFGAATSDLGARTIQLDARVIF
ncbi:MAG: TonB-dependent receptor [Terriglobia bacterium]|jgi:hypothetical protein